MKKITLQNLADVSKAPQKDRETCELMGYELVAELFADSSGFGQDNEPALTVSQFEKETRELVEKHGTLYAALTGVGMFQVYVGFFTKTGAKRAKTAGTHTLHIETNGGYKIRYHATDVIEYHDRDIILNNGGWATVTTRKRINDHLPAHLYIEQKNYCWYVHDTTTGAVVPFYNGMVIKDQHIKPLPALVVIDGRRWFQKTYGNTYHSVRVDIDGETYTHGETYGYGDHYLQTARKLLQDNGYHIPSMSKEEQKHCGTKIVAHVSDVTRQKDLHHVND